LSKITKRNLIYIIKLWFYVFVFKMETGVLGVPFPLVALPAEGEHNLIQDSATIQLHLLEEQHALVQALKMLLAMPSNAQ
jgi:hypothetical protein